MAAQLPKPPADLTILSEVNRGSFPTAYVMETVYGYPGKHSASIMPEFGPLLSGPMVGWKDKTGTEVPTPVALLDLVRYIETLQQ